MATPGNTTTSTPTTSSSNNNQPPAPPSQPPANANEGCVGPQSATAGQASACAGCPNQSVCASGAFSNAQAQEREQAEVIALQRCLNNVSHVVLVLSGKGGVGKSTVAAQLAHTLCDQGYAVGLLDVDLCGPSIPRMVLGNAHSLATIRRHGDGSAHNANSNNTSFSNSKEGEEDGWWVPVYAKDNLAVMSIGFLLQDPDQAVVWRGPRKNQLIHQFLTQVDWNGDTNGLDYLIVDTPPGTSDEHISTVQYLQKAQAVSGAIIVTTPEEISLADVRKEISFCGKTKVPILGVIENMGSYQTRLDQFHYTHPTTGIDVTHQILQALRTSCPEALECMVHAKLFEAGNDNNNETGDNDNDNTGASTSAVEQMAAHANAPFWGRLPLDPLLLQACERGQGYASLYPNAPASIALQQFVDKLVQRLPVAMASTSTAPPSTTTTTTTTS